ncbi:hypothetical protein [Zavarzinella formosa]|uniref:hypothetical protein n=1 Tax=Zavarzinella formosa TaxID=360055 RepID=UPI0002D91ECD|nr:hypothetical protein [Zavarzinella formosa]
MAKKEPVNPIAPYLDLDLKTLEAMGWGVPLVALLAQPVWFDGQYVRAPGFLAVQFGHTALYIGEADYRHDLRANSVWVNLPVAVEAAAREYHERYVLIDGVFRVGPTGQRGNWVSELTQVSRVAISGSKNFKGWSGYGAEQSTTADRGPQSS